VNDAATSESHHRRAFAEAGPRALLIGSGAALSAAAAVATRLLLAAVAVLTTYTVGVLSRPLWLRDPGHAEVLHGALKRLFEPWAHWDGVWFIRIASGGYGSHTSTQAFFPLYPLLLRVFAPAAAHNYVIAGVVISVACYAGAMAVLYRLVNDEAGARVALWSVVFISVFPMALFFQAVYSESLFLLLTLSSFAAARRGRWALAGLAGLLAVLTRSSGLLLVAPLALIWWEQRRGSALRLPGGPALTPPMPTRRPSLRSLGWLALVPAGLALYMTYLWRQFHDPLLFSDAQRAWGRTLALPTTAVWRGLVLAVQAVYWLLVRGAQAGLGVPAANGGWHLDLLARLPEFLALLLALRLLVACWRRLPAPYTVYAAAACLFPLFYPESSQPLSSYPRFLLVNFPLFIALAVLLAESRLWRWVVVGVMLVLSMVATTLFASFA
jgi:hypothetical protein